MPRRNRVVPLPTWLWFFLALPLGLVAVVLWQRRRIKSLIQRRVTIIRRARYVEPDSIPIDTRPSFDMAEMEEAHHTDHVFEISQAALDPGAPPLKTEPFETPSTAGVDDLKVIEGIGPKIAGLLNEHGISSYQQLAATPLEQLDELLSGAKLRRLADPGTWPEQARLAAEGDWDALHQLQGILKAGRRKAG